ncbi:MAG: Hsp20/alpha crystallin family protein [Pseudomonadota bacterium]
MNSIVRSPVNGFDLFGDFDRLVNGFFSPARTDSNSVSARTPAIDVVETETGFEVHAEIPGVSKESLEVSVKENVLKIAAGTDSVKEAKEGEKVIRTERRSGRFVRALRLGDAIDVENISADYVDGVLKVVLPKAEKAEVKTIAVNVH